MIDLNKLNSEEKEAMKELRQRVADVYPQEMDVDGSLFYRFLKARDFNIDRAEKMLRKHFIWRRAFQVGNLLKEYKTKEFYHKYVQPTQLGLDKEGDLIFYAPFGKVDARDALKCITLNECTRTWIWQIEKIRNLIMQHAGEKNSYPQVHVIVDLEELTFSNTTNKGTADILLRLVHVLQDNYPEGMKCIYVINAPSYYVFIWAIVKVIMSNAMIQKIRIYSHSGWEEKLLERIDADVLPAFLGGTRTDPDGNPLCKTFIMHAGKIPSSYYLTNKDRDFKDRSRVKHITVYPSSVKEVCVDVLEEGSVLHWEILIKGKDIGFGLFYKEINEMKTLLPIQRIDSIDGVESNYYRTKFVGKYVFMFDNSYSWLNTKDIAYCITVKREN